MKKSLLYKMFAFLSVLTLLGTMFTVGVLAETDPWDNGGIAGGGGEATGSITMRVESTGYNSARLDVRLNTTGGASPISASGSIDGTWFNRHLGGNSSFSVDIPNIAPGTTIGINVSVEFSGRTHAGFTESDWISYTQPEDERAVQPLEPDSNQLPSVATRNVSNVTRNSADVSIEVLSQGNSLVWRRGIVFSNSTSRPNLSHTNNVRDIGGGTGLGTAHLTGLAQNTTYYVWAFAENSYGVNWGSMVSFRTDGRSASPPTVSTTSVTRSGDATLNVQINVDSDNGSVIIERGVVFSRTNTNPVINQSGTQTQLASGSTGSANVTLTGLVPGSAYYVRAFARNSEGVSYGRVWNIDALDSNYVTDTLPREVTANSATLYGVVASGAMNRVAERGFVYSSTSTVPTMSHQVVRANMNNNASFNATVTGLTPNTVYHARAFVRINTDYYYGQPFQFRTDAQTQLRNVAVLYRDINGVQIGQQQFSLNQGAVITESMLEIPAGFMLDTSGFSHTVGTEASVVATVRHAIAVQPVLTTLRFVINSMTYTVNDVPYQGDAAPFIDTAYSRTMIPLRSVVEALGAQVEWIGETSSVHITRGVVEMHLTIGSPLPDGMGAPVLVNSRTFVPLRYVAEVLGANVNWDEANNAVYIYQ